MCASALRNRNRIAAPIPNARLEILDCGHGIPVEQPRELAASIETFLAEIAARNAAP